MASRAYRIVFSEYVLNVSFVYVRLLLVSDVLSSTEQQNTFSYRIEAVAKRRKKVRPSSKKKSKKKKVPQRSYQSFSHATFSDT